jgi:predicted transcriptional regulator
MKKTKTIKDKILGYIVNKKPERLSLAEISNNFSFGVEVVGVKKHLEKLLSEGSIKSENISFPEGIKTVYFYED